LLEIVRRYRALVEESGQGKELFLWVGIVDIVAVVVVGQWLGPLEVVHSYSPRLGRVAMAPFDFVFAAVFVFLFAVVFAGLGNFYIPLDLIHNNFYILPGLCIHPAQLVWIVR